ncbi:ParB-like dsDNA partitioning protein [Mycobacterium phage Luchador]|uniref:ParB-like dsDNA partitioning protein n=1 Tax=Mycobacterium phage Luchador TaxID=1647300 RepID=A0A0F6WDR5_9CAUD|nr:Arc-like repressor [Mycobacterium phage Luchador]AKF14203.1 ParB-like dsDNA partitioning protein [Mycobacterium phage Luchador]
MSEGLQGKLQKQREASSSKPAKRATEAYHRPADDMAKFTTYLPKVLIDKMKVRAVEEKTTAAKMITEEMEKRLAAPARIPDKPSRPEIT